MIFLRKKVYKRESVEEESQFVRYKFSDAFELLVSSKRAMNVLKPTKARLCGWINNINGYGVYQLYESWPLQFQNGENGAKAFGEVEYVFLN